MNSSSKNIRTFAVYIGLSVVVHLLVLISLGRFGSYSFAAPVNPLHAVMVELAKPDAGAAAVEEPSSQETNDTDDIAEDRPDDKSHAQVLHEEVRTPPPVPEKSPVEPKAVEPAAVSKEKTNTPTRTAEPAIVPKPAASRHTVSLPAPPPPLRTASEFMSTKSEKLTYLITVLGMPVGNLELEAINENGEIRITLRTKSNSALSSIYPVDDLIETRHIGGNFIITKIKQHEGSFSSDIGFTIFLRDKRVFWVNRLRNQHSDETIPNSDVLDTLSSLYYLRNRPLQTGTTEILHIYDGDIYAPVPVEIVRQEEIRLRNLKKVDTLLVRHLKQKGGIFRRTGDMSIWLTNDGNKVPVKLETTSPLGKVTIELVSAETEQFDVSEHKNSSR